MYNLNRDSENLRKYQLSNVIYMLIMLKTNKCTKKELVIQQSKIKTK